MIKRVLKYSVLGISAVGLASSLHTNDYNLNSLGVVRLARSAVAVYDVTLLYKRQLYYKTWDKTDPEYKVTKSRVHKLASERLLQLCCINKGVYIKVGQHIGALDYLLPKEFVETMKILHSNAPQNPIEDIYKVIKQDLKQAPENIFLHFDEKPLGTASLAQVHKAQLKSGEIVAVKVQHPYVKGNSRIDMKSMEIAVKILSLIFPDFKIQWLIDETKRNLPIELDFLNEGCNAEKVAKQFSKYNWLRIPKIYWQFSTSRILIMEYLEGGQVNDINYIKQHKIDPLIISNRLGKLYSEMIFNTGFVHSDPHPGNILVRKDSKSNVEIILLDHGLYANLTDKFRYDYSKLWLSILNVDRTAMRKYSENLGIKGDLYGLFACMITGRPWETVVQGVNKIKYTKVEKDVLQNTTSLVLPSISDVLEQVDRQMLLILKTNDLIRGIESTLHTQNRMAAFWVMSKCCVQSSFSERKIPNMTRQERFVLYLEEKWQIFKLNIYYFCLGLINYGFMAMIKEFL